MNKLLQTRSKVLFTMGVRSGLGKGYSTNLTKDRKPATSYTIKAQEKITNELPFEDIKDFEYAEEGFKETLADPVIKTSEGKIVWNLNNFSFIKQKEPAPQTVNPSLWRQAQLNNNFGLFQVIDKVYQLRGLDLANMTIIEGETGLIVIDPLTSKEAAQAGMELYYTYKAKNWVYYKKVPIVAVVSTHSHVDHFGGLEGIISYDDVIQKKVKVYAPLGFMEHSVSENVYAGNAMKRRATYMYGAFLKYDEQGVVDNGIGKTHNTGTSTLIAPTDIIDFNNKSATLAGVDIEFLYAPDTEAPSEMDLYFPQLRVLLVAENATKSMHNILTLRGAQVRDALNWSNSLAQLIDKYGQKTDYMICQHNWPTWGTKQIIEQLESQRDMYKFIHDQSLYLLNQGYKPLEIADQIQLPDSLAKKWYNRGYYGALKVNSRAVYQKYIGWYDGNPTNLDPLPTKEASIKLVKYMGQSSKIIEQAMIDYNNGEYRWVAQIMNTVVQAEPNNQQARLLEADALEQLGYQSESGPWRNEYLMAAYELRNGLPDFSKSTTHPSFIKAMTITQIFDTIAIHLNAKRSENFSMDIMWDFTDINEQYLMTLQNCVLLYKQITKKARIPPPVIQQEKKIVYLTLTHEDLAKYSYDLAELVKHVKLEGSDANVEFFNEFLSFFDQFNHRFNIMIPVDA